jgi:hypothetical protein
MVRSCGHDAGLFVYPFVCLNICSPVSLFVCSPICLPGGPQGGRSFDLVQVDVLGGWVHGAAKGRELVRGL